jgi:hypothetical protein
MPAFESHWYDLSNKKKLFWILQCLGWGSLVVLGTARKLLLAGRCLRKLMRGPEGGEKGVVRDHEVKIEHSEALIYLSMTKRMLSRIAA